METNRFSTMCYIVAVGGTTTFDVPPSLQNMPLVLEENSEYLCKWYPAPLWFGEQVGISEND